MFKATAKSSEYDDVIEYCMETILHTTLTTQQDSTIKRCIKKILQNPLKKEDAEPILYHMKEILQIRKENIEKYKDINPIMEQFHKELEDKEIEQYDRQLTRQYQAYIAFNAKLDRIEKKCISQNPEVQQFADALKDTNLSANEEIEMAQKLLNKPILNEVFVSCFHTEAEKALKEFATQYHMPYHSFGDYL